MKKKVIFIGSSVCYGGGTPDHHGWSAMLAERLEQQGCETSNCAISGQNSAQILLRLQRDVIDHKPDYCFVGLGLANEGFAFADTAEERAIVRGLFERNLKEIVKALQENSIKPIIGGVYPNNRYTEIHYEGLKNTEQVLKSWGVPVLSWLDALSDAQGHFKEGLFNDDGHPNADGYRVMYECIPQNILEQADTENK